MGGSTLYNIRAKNPGRHQLSDLWRPTGINVSIRRLPLAHPRGRKIASVTTSIAVGRPQSPTCYLSLQTPARMANRHYLPMDPRRLCSTNDRTGWSRIQGARIHTLTGEATETPSRRLSLAAVAISLPILLIYYRNTNLYLNGSGGPGTWDLRGWIRVS